MHRILLVIYPLAFCLACVLDGVAQTARYALPAAYIAFSNSVANPGKVPPPKLERDANLEITDWRTDFAPVEKAGEYVLQFNPAIRSGTLLAYGVDSVEFLSQGEWKTLNAALDRQRLLQVIPFPAGENVQALRMQVRPDKATNPSNGRMEYRSTLQYLAVIPVRAVNIASEASITASHTVGEVRPEALKDGAVDVKKNFFTGKPSATGAEWIQLVWPKPTNIRGLCLFRGSEDAGFGFANVYINSQTNITSPAEENWSEGWRRLSISQVAESNFRNLVFMVFDGQATTRALSFRSHQVEGIGLGEILVLQTLPK